MYIYSHAIVKDKQPVIKIRDLSPISRYRSKSQPKDMSIA
jgi:hypothetical protein